MFDRGHALAKAALFCAAFLFLATGCATPDSFGGSRTAVVRWGNNHGFAPADLDAGAFRLLALSRQSGPAPELAVYIEGDGAPWATAHHPPHDPTPIKPVALAMASNDNSPAVVYLGRPCQYLDEARLSRCDSAYWTERRFAPEVIAAYDEALNRLMAIADARRLRLVGYSGGGVIATLLAMRRTDVAALVTVASPLALADWVSHHGVTPLTGSLDPLTQSGNVPAGVHWAGGHDKSVPVAVVDRFVREKGGRRMTMPNYDHECCWAREWAKLLSRSTIEEEHP